MYRVGGSGNTNYIDIYIYIPEYALHLTFGRYGVDGLPNGVDGYAIRFGIIHLIYLSQGVIILSCNDDDDVGVLLVSYTQRSIRIPIVSFIM